MFDVVKILSELDGLIAELQNGDEEAIEDAREILHAVTDNSNATQLILLLTPIKVCAEIDVKKDV